MHWGPWNPLGPRGPFESMSFPQAPRDLWALLRDPRDPIGSLRLRSRKGSYPEDPWHHFGIPCDPKRNYLIIRFFNYFILVLYKFADPSGVERVGAKWTTIYLHTLHPILRIPSTKYLLPLTFCTLSLWVSPIDRRSMASDQTMDCISREDWGILSRAKWFANFSGPSDIGFLCHWAKFCSFFVHWHRVPLSLGQFFELLTYGSYVTGLIFSHFLYTDIRFLCHWANFCSFFVHWHRVPMSAG